MGAHRLFWVVVMAFTLGLVGHANAQSPAYLFTMLGSPDYIDMGPGNDMLALTDDDVELAEGGNLGGGMSFAHFDNNSNGAVDDGDRFFIQARDPDGAIQTDQTLFSVSSRPEYGTIYESEDWDGHWEVDYLGPSAVNSKGEPQSRLEAAIAQQLDFEINDNNGWTDESNAYIYNNLGNNQRGAGLVKYAFEYRHPDNPGKAGWALDEAEGWSKTDCFVGVLDDPRTTFDERGNCRRWDREREGLVKKGYLIPVEDLETLVDGQLPTLFGWEDVDLAAYMRDTVGGLIESPNVTVPVEGAPAEVVLPLTHVMLLQTSYALNVDNSDGECGGTGTPECADQKDTGLCAVQTHGDYWGIPQDGSGTLRRSQLMGANHILTDLTFGEGAIHQWVHEAEDGSTRNLWELDHFYRGELNPEDNDYNVGDYEAHGDAGLLVQASSILQVIDATNDGELALRGPGSVTTGFSRALGEGEYPIEIVADLAENLSPPEDGVAAGAAGLTFQIILRRGNTVIAYADISEDATAVYAGGTYDPATGTASGGEGGEAGNGATIGAVDSVAAGGEITRFILSVSSSGITLREAASGVYETNNFLDLDAIGEELASAGGASGEATMLTIATNGEAVVDTLAVFASPGTGPFSRGDCNGDGSNDVSDGVTVLNFSFLGTDAPGCLAACDFNADGNLDVTNAVYYFSALFLGGSPVPGPINAFSQRASDASVGCANPSV